MAGDRHSPGRAWLTWAALSLFSLLLIAAGDSYPALRFRASVIQGFRLPLRLVSWIPQRFDLAAENRRLRERTIDLFIENSRLREYALEAIRLEALLGMRPQPELRRQAARVIARGSSLGPQSVVLDRGDLDSVRVGDALLTAYGLAGTVVQTGSHSATAALLGHRDFRCRALVQRTREEGILAGSGPGELVLQEIPLSSDLQVDDVIVTSGKGSRFPGGVPIAVVREVRPGTGLFLEVRLRPLARLTRLEELYVIGRREP